MKAHKNPTRELLLKENITENLQLALASGLERCWSYKEEAESAKVQKTLKQVEDNARGKVIRDAAMRGRVVESQRQNMLNNAIRLGGLSPNILVNGSTPQAGEEDIDDISDIMSVCSQSSQRITSRTSSPGGRLGSGLGLDSLNFESLAETFKIFSADRDNIQQQDNKMILSKLDDIQETLEAGFQKVAEQLSHFVHAIENQTQRSR